MSTSESYIREVFDELKPGDRIEVQHTVTESSRTRTTTTIGSVVRTERGRAGLHFHGSHEQGNSEQGNSEQGSSEQGSGHDLILLELPDGELATVAVDESTVLRRA